MRYALIYIIASQLVSLQDVFHLAVQFSKYNLRPSPLRALASGADFFKSSAPSGSLSLTLRSQVFAFAIPENDTGSRRRTVIRLFH